MISFFDTNIWSFLAVPVGVIVCFGPGLALWIRQEYFSRTDEDSEAGH